MSSATAIGLLEPVTVRPPGDTVTVYEVIAEPPSVAGGAKVTTASVPTAVAATLVGTPGGPSGVTAFDGADAALVPEPFMAVTAKV